MTVLMTYVHIVSDCFKLKTLFIDVVKDDKDAMSKMMKSVLRDWRVDIHSSEY